MQWLSSESIIPRLTSLLSPNYYSTHHDTATDLLKGIITMSAPAPGPFNPHSGASENGGGGSEGGGALGGMRNNKFARELVAEDTVERLVGYMLDEAAEHGVDPASGTIAPPSAVLTNPKGVDPKLASLAATSSLVSSIAIFIELIRKNNSDYSEPHLFHTLRNGLMAKSSATAAAAASRAQDGDATDLDQKDIEDRKDMEEAMEGINNKMGIVHLGSMLTVLSARLGSFQDLVNSPRTKVSSTASCRCSLTSKLTSPCPSLLFQPDYALPSDCVPPLTVERFRVVELYAELLHCSNMAILNRPNGTGPTYDDDGRLLGGLSGLDELSAALSGAEGDDTDKPNEDVVLQGSKGLPVSSSSTDASSGDEISDGEMEDVSVEDLPESPAKDDEDPSTPPASAPIPTLNLPSSSSSDDGMAISAAPSDVASVSRHAVQATTAAPSVTSEEAAPASASKDDLPPGDLLKQKFIEHGLLITLFVSCTAPPA